MDEAVALGDQPIRHGAQLCGRRRRALHRRIPSVADRCDARRHPHRDFDGIAQLEREAEQRGCDTGALALAWVMDHPQVTATICGPSRRAEHLGLAKQALTIELDESARTKIGAWFETNG